MKPADRQLSWLLLVALVLVITAARLQAAEEGKLKAKVSPGRAGVFVDGKYVGPARDFGFMRWYELTVGEHQVVLREPRYKEYSTTVTITPGQGTVLDVGMEPVATPQPPFGTLRTHSKSRFNPVFLNGHYMGHVDEFDNPFQGLLIAPGEYDLQILSPDGQEYKEKVKIEANKTTKVSTPF